MLNLLVYKNTLKLASEPVLNLSSSYLLGGEDGAGGGGNSPVLSNETLSESELGYAGKLKGRLFSGCISTVVCPKRVNGAYCELCRFGGSGGGFLATWGLAP